jgi:hypothetical protein
MSETPTKTTEAPGWLCDEPGCHAAAAIGVGGRRACYQHALERGNASRAVRGLPPVVITEEGELHVRQ